jgi:SAM-dependent methyltransferase
MRKLPKIEEDLTKEVKLNIGCGFRKEEGFIGIDRRDCGQEIIWDVRDGIPFPDESVDFIWSSHVMEHFTNAESKELFKEFYRVLRKGGITRHILPHADDPTAYFFDHLSFWNEKRINTITGIPGLEGFEIIQNESTTDNNNINMLELVFALKKK